MFKISIEVRVPKEINEYKEKILFGLSIRQLFSFVIALILGFASYYVVSKLFNKEVASYVVILITMPIFAFGFFKKDGFPFEKYIVIIIKQKLGTSKRVYKTNLSINDLEREEGGKVGDKKTYRKKKRKDKQREYEIFEISKKGTKRKSKEINRKIKEARKQYKIAKQRTKETPKKEKIA